MEEEKSMASIKLDRVVVWAWVMMGNVREKWGRREEGTEVENSSQSLVA